jgi:hypothetical protein
MLIILGVLMVTGVWVQWMHQLQNLSGAATGNVVSRQTGTNAGITRAVLEACRAACATCAAECEQHAGMHEHCRICAEACRQCEAACKELLAALA